MNIKKTLNNAIIIKRDIENENDYVYHNINEKEERRYNKFRNKCRKKHGSNAVVSLNSTPTGIGSCVFVKDELTGKEKDITDYDSW